MPEAPFDIAVLAPAGSDKILIEAINAIQVLLVAGKIAAQYADGTIDSASL